MPVRRLRRALQAGAIVAGGVLAVVACESDPLSVEPAKVKTSKDAGCPLVTEAEVDGASCAPHDPGPTDVHVVGAAHACAWRTKGSVSCWGRNLTGELGDTVLTPHTTPFVVPGITDALQVTVGDWGTGGFSCALLADHTVSCWGHNNEGQLGDGTMSTHPGDPVSIDPSYRAAPAPVVGLSDVVEIASNTHHSCARLSNGEVRCWGMGRDCGIGNGTCGDAPTPVAPVGLSGVTQLALGFTFSCALKDDGAVFCWGSNAHKEVDSSGIAVLVPTRVPGIANAVRLSSNAGNVCAQLKDASVVCWGYGLLGTCAQTDGDSTPAPVHGIPCGSVLMPGGSCVLASDGSPWCWTLTGDGTNVVHGEAATRVPLDGIAAVTAYGALFAVGRDGRVWSWGSNQFGQLGNGTTEDQWTPGLITIPP